MVLYTTLCYNNIDYIFMILGLWECKARNNPQVSQLGVFDPNIIFIEDKFMRREFVEFNEIFPDKYSHQKAFINSITLKLRKKIVDLQLKHCPAGSESWHKLQQRYSLLSTSNVDTSVRSYFIEKSIKYSGGKLYICPHSIICYPYKVSIGYNCFINRNVYITARSEITIGSNVLIGPGVIINSGMHHYKKPNILIRDQGHHIKPITIGNDVWLGANAMIMPGVIIGDGCVIGAGAIVTKSLPPYSVAVGVPAKIIKRRK